MLLTPYQKALQEADAGDAAQNTSPSVLTPYQQALQDDTNAPSVAEARKYLGQQSYTGLCQAFAEAITDGHTGEYPSAIDAFNSYAKTGQAQDPSVAKPGDLIYFSPNSGNGNFGHVGIVSGNGNFISATDNGIQELPIDQWSQQTGQQILGVVPK